MSRVPPHNLQAEESMLGAMLLSREAVAACLDVGLEAADFYKPAHGHIYDAVAESYGRGERTDPVTVAEVLRRAGALDLIGGDRTLVTLQAGTPTISNAAKYARIVGEHAMLRRLIRTCGDITEMAYCLPGDVGAALDEAKEMIQSVDLPDHVKSELVDSVTFVAGDDSYDWLVPWLIERGERMLVVAGESGGKSMLLRMLAVCCAWGIHPWNNQSITQRRVVLIDLENPVNLIRRKMRPMVAQARAQRPLANPSMLSVLCRPGGINVAKPADSRWLAGQLAQAKPDLVVCGPLYKMFDADDKWESGARAVTAVLDDLRTRMGFSLILETHAPQEYGGKRNLRPIGSSIWLRWPEFVMSFAPVEAHPHVVRITTLKGRDERHWPTFMERGGLWPWTPCRDPEGPKGRPDPEPPRENTGPNFTQDQAF